MISFDGIAYWPNSEEEIASIRCSHFFQTAAASGEDIKSNNPYRLEDANLATALDEKLKAIWQ